MKTLEDSNCRIIDEPHAAYQVTVMGSPIRSKWYRDKPIIRYSPSEGIIRNAVIHLVKEARFSLKRALGRGCQVSILHAKDKCAVASFMVRNYKYAFCKRPL